MSRSVTFNGSTIYKAGGLTRVNADALNPVVAGSNSVIGIIGEADGGAPGLSYLDSPDTAKLLYTSGNIPDAVRAAFSPSNDPLIPGGASRVYIYKTNASTQSSVYLPGSAATAAVSSTATGGSTTTVVDTAQTSANSYDGKYTGMTLVLRPYAANLEVVTVTGYVASTGTFTVSTLSTTAAAANSYVVLPPTVVSVAAVTSGTTLLITPTGAAYTVNEHTGRLVVVHTASGVSYTRTIASNSATVLTLSSALPAAPTTTSWIEILPKIITLTSRKYGVAANGVTADMASSSGAKVATITYEGVNEVSPLVGNFPFLKVLYTGGAASITDAVTGSASTTTVVNLLAAGLTVNAHIGKQVLIGSEYTTIVSNTAGALTVFPALSAAPAAAVVVVIKSRAFGAFTGTSGAATAFTTTLGVTADLSIILTSGQTLRSLVSAINVNPNYTASVPAGINADTTLVADFDFGAGAIVNINNSASLTLVGFTQNVVQMVNYFNQMSAHVTAVRSTSGSLAGSYAPGDIEDPLPLTGGTRGYSHTSDFQAGHDAFLQLRINSVVPLMDATITNTGETPTVTTVPVASVAAQLRDHVVQCRGSSVSERGGFMGFSGTKTAIITQANALNDSDVALCVQSPTVVNSVGALQTFSPFMMAVLAAGCRAGVSTVGEALTAKLLKVSALTQDSSWSPTSLTDANDLIKAGVLFAQTVSGAGTKWVRDLTTWVTDDNLAYMEGNVRDSVRYVAYGLRKAHVDRYVGKKALPATVANMKITAVSFLEQCKTDGIITNSTDLATGAVVNAYHGLKITTSGDTARLTVGFFPTPSINFILQDLYLELATQST